MQERTRYRISGSLFLLALAVIFVPMIFDGSGPPLTAMPPAPARGAPVEVAAFDEIVPASDVLERVDALDAEIDADGHVAVTGEKLGEPALRGAGDDTHVWAVQAGSFSNVDNARKLRQRLRDAGMEAFISAAKEPGEATGSVMHRVAVGPYLARADAVAAADQIRTGFQLEPRLVEMLP